MKQINLLNATIYGLIILSTAITSFSQKRPTRVVEAKPKTIVFAVLDDGKTLEPIGEIVKGELTATANGGDEQKVLSEFTSSYYKSKTAYNLIFGGASNGTVTVKSFDVKAECARNLAQAATESAKAKLKGFVMALATNLMIDKTNSPVRRLPTATERAEIESLVRAEFAKQKVTANAAKKLNYYNLTALDIDNDGKAEMVGSFWVESSAKERNLLFFIAEQNSGGKYQFGYSEYKKVTPAEMMSGDLKDLDEGIGSELLLDTLDYNGDKNAEIFTISRAFEGNNFHVYRRQAGKWNKIFEGYNYHCGY